MNIYIPISILMMTALFVIIKLFPKYGVNPEQGIIFNYLTAALSAFLFDYQTNITNINLLPGCFKSAWFIGFLFVAVFLMTAHVIHTAGITITSVISKMSVIIPVVVGIFLYNEQLDFIKTCGIGLALLAVFLINIQRNPQQLKPAGIGAIVLLIIYFLGSGLVDTSIKYAQAKLITPQNGKLYIVAIFASAFSFGLMKLIYEVVTNKTKINFRSFAGGCVLGLANFFSLIFVIKALAFQGALSAVTYPIMNVGVLMLSAFTGMWLFREKLEPVNYAGLIFAAVAIVVLSF